MYMYNPRQTELLAQYVFTLAKYDQNYDIRDRSRFFRALIFPNQVGIAVFLHRSCEHIPLFPLCVRACCNSVRHWVRAKFRTSSCVDRLSSFVNCCVYARHAHTQVTTVSTSTFDRSLSKKPA
ncbi:unnamed protein product [Schistocephalus solidus]|uniref:Uncharacterized protein n=1 Tax=Schistocephalus solidus TaxID=70667 RepID=A0A3P7C1T2_SCHSO|nr:unnamed protein product [Schistocephalus solidus]